MPSIPSATSSETEIAGALLVAGYDALDQCAAVEPEHFFDAKARTVFTAARELAEQGEHIDIVFIAAHIAQAGGLETIGGLPALVELATDNLTTVGLHHHARRIRKAALYRAVIEANRDISQAAYKHEDIGEIVARMRRASDEFEAWGTGPADAFSEIDLNDDGRIHDPQWAIHGLLPASGVTLAIGNTSVGKSSLAVAVAAYIASEQFDIGGRAINVESPHVIHIDPEGTAQTISNRLRAIISEHGWNAYAARQLEANFHHLDARKHKLTNGLTSILFDAASAYQPSMIIIDGLLRSAGIAEENSNAEMAAAMDSIASIADRLACPIWVNHHVSKGDRQKGSYPMARGASAVEDAADAIAIISHDADTGTRTISWRKGREIGIPMHNLEYVVHGINVGRDANGQSVTAPAVSGFEWIKRSSKDIRRDERVQFAEQILRTLNFAEMTTAELVEAGLSKGALHNFRKRDADIADEVGVGTRLVDRKVIWFDSREV